MLCLPCGDRDGSPRSPRAARVAGTSLLALLLLLTCAPTSHVHALADEDLPHVDTCNYCYDCVLDGPPPQQLSTRRVLEWRPPHTAGRKEVEQRTATDGGASRALRSNSGGSSSSSSGSSSRQSRYQSARPTAGMPRHRRGVLQDEEPLALETDPQAQPDLTQLIRPLDGEAKGLLPNCTRCRGCSVELSEIHTSLNTFGDGVTFVHGKGATNGWIFFAKVAGSSTRHIVKVNCMPYSKLKGPAKMQECFAHVYLSRFQLVMGQRKLAEDCGVSELTPRTWMAPVNAIAPKGCKGFGYHIRWHGLWSEEAQGITLHGLYMARKDEMAMTLLSEKMNRTQVVLGAIMDLLTAQCDRHSENVFIKDDGNLQFIDNDRALGVVTRCGADSMLLPGTRYHGALRTGLYHHTQAFYRHNMDKPGFCHGPVDARVLTDYRCWVPNGVIGKNYPPGVQSCLTRLAGSTHAEIVARYGLPNEKKPALILHRRAKDMLRNGFEWTLRNGPPISLPKFRQVHQPPCCKLHRAPHFVTCDVCWAPIFDMLDNSTVVDDDPDFTGIGWG